MGGIPSPPSCIFDDDPNIPKYDLNITCESSSFSESEISTECTLSDYNDNFSMNNIIQLDGNVSVISTKSVSQNDGFQSGIPVITNLFQRNKSQHSLERHPIRKTVRRGSKVVQGLTLPKFANYSMHS